MDRRALQRLCLFLAVVKFLLLSGIVAETWDLTNEERVELKKQLKSLNKPYITTFKDEYGITYDCVDMYKQAAFDHPLLRNHTLQLKFEDFSPTISSTVSRFPKRCPESTVLIRRTTMLDLIRENKRKQNTTAQMKIIEQSDLGETHYAGVRIVAPKGQSFYGVTANLDVYQLSGISRNQWSASQIVLTKGMHGPRKYYNRIHVGWQVDFLYEGDDYTHFFTYWKSDRFGCINMRCKGFVQRSDSITPGMILKDANLPLTIQRDAFTLNWLLIHNDGSHLIGYWPKEIFNNMADSTEIQLGGSAYSPFTQPSPPLGNGNLNGAKCTKIRLVDGHRKLIAIPPNTAETIQDLKPPFYDTNYNYGAIGELKYGGPGGWKS